VTDAKEIDRLQESLEKIVGTSSRSLQRTASKRPLVGDVKQSGNKSLLYNLMGGPPVLSASVSHAMSQTSALSPSLQLHGGQLDPQYPLFRPHLTPQRIAAFCAGMSSTQGTHS